MPGQSEEVSQPEDAEKRSLPPIEDFADDNEPSDDPSVSPVARAALSDLGDSDYVRAAVQLPPGYQAALDALNGEANRAAVAGALQSAADIQTTVANAMQPVVDARAAVAKLLEQNLDTRAVVANALQPMIDARAAVMRSLDQTIDINAAITRGLVQTDVYQQLIRGFNTSSITGLKLGRDTSPKVRPTRTAGDFFASFEGEVGSVSQLLRALAVMQEKNSHLGLMWRGQQHAGWAVESSLTRRLRRDKVALGEDEMISVERLQIDAANRWAMSRPLGDLNFLAELQHQEVPTRLIDVSLDPEVAVWFSVQDSTQHEKSDARLLAWGRAAAPKRNHSIASSPSVPPAGGDAFWQLWADKEARMLNKWGTGQSVPSWQPVALNERMRAQRAAFLFDAEPIIDDRLLELFNEQLEGDWKAGEIAKATRIVGFPSAHNRRAKSNPARIVPMFSLWIAAEAKPAIREYLARKGLTEETIYPDRAGLISHLRRDTGIGLLATDDEEKPPIEAVGKVAD